MSSTMFFWDIFYIPLWSPEIGAQYGVGATLHLHQGSEPSTCEKAERSIRVLRLEFLPRVILLGGGTLFVRGHPEFLRRCPFHPAEFPSNHQQLLIYIFWNIETWPENIELKLICCGWLRFTVHWRCFPNVCSLKNFQCGRNIYAS